MSSSQLRLRNQFDLSRTKPILTVAFAFGALNALSISTAIAASTTPAKATFQPLPTAAQNDVSKPGEHIILAQAGRGQPPNGRGAPIDLSQAAAELGVSEDSLRDALGAPPPDFAAAAEALGIPEEKLRSVLPPPPPRR